MRRTPCGCNLVQELPTVYKLIHALCLPLTRHGTPSRRALRAFERTLAVGRDDPGAPVQELPSAYTPTARDCHGRKRPRNDKQDTPPCHCEERSDAAISCRNYRLHTNLQSEIATGASALAMTNKVPLPVIARSVATW